MTSQARRRSGVDVETTGTNPDSDKIIELGIWFFEYDRLNGRI
jgi:DNA polymerase III epsilon subunit-like protein